MASSHLLQSPLFWAVSGATALAWVATIGACTQDFDQFASRPSTSATGTGTGGGTTGPGGAGAAGASGPGGGSASGGGGQGGNAQGGNAQGGSAMGGSAMGGSAMGGSAMGGQGGGIGGAAGAGGSSGGNGGMGGAPGCPLGFACVPQIVAGEYAVGALGAALVCPAGWSTPTTVSNGNNPGCTACGCAAPSNGTCDSGDIHRFANANCTGAQQTIANPTDGQCIDIFTGASGFSVDEPTPAGGGCEPSMSTPVPLTQGIVCTASAGVSCGAGMVCVPDSAAPFTDACNLLPGNVACPAGWPSKLVAYGTATDTRVCDCNCGMPQSAGCAGASIQLFAGNVCANAALATIVANGMCVDTAALNTNDSLLVEAGTWSAASCPSQDNHSGGVVFSGDLSLCCPP